MDREQIFEELNIIFRSNFDDDTINLQEDTTSEDIEDWDSIEQISIIMAMQDRFKIKFNIEEVNSMKNVGEMVNLIRKKMED